MQQTYFSQDFMYKNIKGKGYAWRSCRHILKGDNFSGQEFGILVIDLFYKKKWGSHLYP